MYKLLLMGAQTASLLLLSVYAVEQRNLQRFIAQKLTDLEHRIR
jgi:hypothetical protein